jgi:hypothetical protein
MKNRLYAVLAILGVSLFIGVVVISVGVGSVIPQLNQVAGPIVCGKSNLEVVQHVDRFRPGETYYSISAYCVDDTTGDKKDVTNLVQLVAGAIYSVIPFVVITSLFIKYRDTLEKRISMSR